jgi:hypothetical protein
MNTFLQKLPVLGILFLLAFSLNLQAQAPRKFSYQAVVRDAAGNLVINRPVGIRFTILRGSATGIAVFAETHRPTTNNDGLASVEIGGGAALFNAIGNIDWALGPYYLKTEIDPNGATAYSIIGTNQLLSVPYALYAEKSANPGNPGFNTLIRTEPASPRTGTCRFGGVTFYFGLDANRNNILDNSEIDNTLTKFVCNGKDGKGIVATLDNGNGTFTFTYTDGTSFTTSNLTGPQGTAGVGIVSTVDNGNGSFTLNYSNGTSFTTGNLTGPQGTIGAQGPQGIQGPVGSTGPQGIQGQQGPAGANGQDGVSVTNSFVQGDSLYVTLSNGQTLNTGYVKGPQGATGPMGATGPQGLQGIQGPIGQTGATGPQGQAGTNGTNGIDGVSIINSYVQGDSLYVVLSNGQSLNTGYVRGPQGLSGVNGNGIDSVYYQNDSLFLIYTNGNLIGLQTNNSSQNLPAGNYLHANVIQQICRTVNTTTNWVTYGDTILLDSMRTYRIIFESTGSNIVNTTNHTSGFRIRMRTISNTIPNINFDNDIQINHGRGGGGSNTIYSGNTLTNAVVLGQIDCGPVSCLLDINSSNVYEYIFSSNSRQLIVFQLIETNSTPVNISFCVTIIPN